MRAVLLGLQVLAQVVVALEGPGGDLVRQVIDMTTRFANGDEPTADELEYLHQQMNAAVQRAHLSLTRTP